MTLHSFASGERIKLGTEIYHMRRKLSDGTWRLEKESNGEYQVMDEQQLRQLYQENRMRFIAAFINDEEELDEATDEKIKKNFADYPENLRNEAQRRLKYIRAFEDANPRNPAQKLKELAEKFGENQPASIISIRRWSKALKSSSGNICSLLPKYKGRGNRSPRYSQEIVEIALREIDNIYLKPQRKTLLDTLSAVRNSIERENIRRPDGKKLAKPGRKFLRNLVKGIDAYEIMLSRYGKTATNHYFRETLTSGETVSEPLIRAEIDHTVLDLIVVSGETYLPLGRPTLTVAIDRCTRCLLGYHIGFDPPSYIAVMKCLSHSIKPKDYISSRYPDIENSWPCWGLPQLVVCDNGNEFHSKDLESAAMSLLIDLRFTPVRQPWWKGAVERFFGTINKSLIHALPGTTFSNVIEKNEYASLKHAIVTEENLHEMLHFWICDIYHQTVNRTVRRTPASLWRDKIDSSRQKLPASVEVLDISLASTENRTVFGYGVSLNNLNYNSQELQRIRRKKGNVNVLVRWDRSNLGTVYILDEDANKYLRVPCTWKSYAEGLSLWLHREIRKEAASKEGSENEAKLDAAKNRIRELCQKAMRSKKLVTRKAAARAEQSLNINQVEQTDVLCLSGIEQKEIIGLKSSKTQFSVVVDDNEDIPDFAALERN